MRIRVSALMTLLSFSIFANAAELRFSRHYGDNGPSAGEAGSRERN